MNPKDMMIEAMDFAQNHPLSDDLDLLEGLEKGVRTLEAKLYKMKERIAVFEDTCTVSNPSSSLALFARWEALESEKEDFIHDSNMDISRIDDDLDVIEEDLGSRSNWEIEQDQAVFWDIDEIQRFGGIWFGASKVEGLQASLSEKLEEGAGALRTLKESLLRLEEKIDEEVVRFKKEFDELRTLRVYRLLRASEDPDEGLHREFDFDPTISIADHILSGSYTKTRFISCSKDPLVCLFYAAKAVHHRDSPLSDLRIAKIDLHLNDYVEFYWKEVNEGTVIDFTDPETRRLVALDIETRSTADNYARVFREVVVTTSISPSEIVDVCCIDDFLHENPMPLNCNRFRGFIAETQTNDNITSLLEELRA